MKYSIYFTEFNESTSFRASSQKMKKGIPQAMDRSYKQTYKLMNKKIDGLVYFKLITEKNIRES